MQDIMAKRDEPADASPRSSDEDGRASRRALTPAAERALAEAAERRQRSDPSAARPKEVNGRDGPEPIRYGDWEKNGIISDF